MKRVLLGLLLLSSIQIFAQNEADTTVKDSTWLVTGGVSLNINQVGLYNWQGGGEPSFSATLLYKGNFDYSKKKTTWNSYIDFAYGLIRQGKKPMTKSDDRWEIGTKLGHQLNKSWDFNGFATLRSQFTEGFDEDDENLEISNFMAPAYLLAGIGFNFKKGKWLNVNLSPLTNKTTFVLDTAIANLEVLNDVGEGTGKGKYGNELGNSVRAELGAFAKITISKEIFKNVKLNTSADFFTDYLENFGVIDVNWNLTALFQVNKYITCTVTTNLIYDQDISIVLEKNNKGEAVHVGPAVQFKETIGLGITYTY